MAGNVNEEGMRWYRNGSFVQRNTGHYNVIPNYTFHGTYTQVYSGTRIAYDDRISFRHNIGGGGDAAINLAGNMVFSK